MFAELPSERGKEISALKTKTKSKSEISNYEKTNYNHHGARRERRICTGTIAFARSLGARRTSSTWRPWWPRRSWWTWRTWWRPRRSAARSGSHVQEARYQQRWLVEPR